MSMRERLQRQSRKAVPTAPDEETVMLRFARLTHFSRSLHLGLYGYA